MFPLRALPLIISLFLPSWALGGVIVTISSFGENNTYYFEGGRVAFHEEGALRIIVDLEKGEFTEVSHEHGVYTRIGLRDLVSQIESMVSQQMEILRSMPDYEELLAQRNREQGRPVEIRTLPARSIGGWDAEGYAIVRDEEVLSELWVSPVLTDTITAAGFDYTRLREFSQLTQAAMVSLLGNDPELKARQEIESRGFVILEKEGNPYTGQPEVVEELMHAAKGPVDPSVFSIPESFRQIEYHELLELMDGEDEGDEGW